MTTVDRDVLIKPYEGKASGVEVFCFHLRHPSSSATLFPSTLQMDIGDLVTRMTQAYLPL